MFGFLKEKLKNAINKFSRGVRDSGNDEASIQDSTQKSKERQEEKTERAKETTKETFKETFTEKLKEKGITSEEHKTFEAPAEQTEPQEQTEKAQPELSRGKTERKGILSKIFGKKKGEGPKPIEEEYEKHDEEAKKEEKIRQRKEIKTERESEVGEKQGREKEKKEREEKIERIEKIIKEKETPKEEEKKGFFGRITESITTTQISEKKFDELFYDLEIALLENNVAVEVIDKIKNDLKGKIVEQKIKRSEVDEVIVKSLIHSLDDVLSQKKIDIISMAKTKKPLVLMFVGVNGSGKTTNLVKIAKFLEKNNLKTVIAACDTFRAGAIQQLEEHANNVGVRVVKHDYGADPAAVAFDAIEHAKARSIDVVLIDTAGRLHSNTNLMDEMKKIARVAKPDLKLFIGESITGNDCVEQAKEFDSAIGIDGIILTKADIDDKGGAALSISYVTKKPIIFIGTGQDYDDIKEFDKTIILANLGLAS